MRALIFACAVLIPFCTQAQNMKPGLWEIRQLPQLDPQRQAQLDEAKKRMAELPPEQRKMVEQMMAQRGVNIDLGGGGITIKACISEEQARRNTPPVTEKGNCRQDTKREGNVIQTHFSCTDPVSEGDSEVTLHGDEGFSSKTRVTQQSAGGRSETIQLSGDARWLGADCGGLKPIGSK
ncbi:DUF3617 domain-containing protein [Roseateles violae]|uniref:DUF3617 domain-containing protein n=1 Tax=Roseateles violae TaxID=3058042 RepID=A0ABT8DP50_9BURK|nr:DUF3617 domain-containing protein [Pelomonas sp. PFR6]MDN3920127.1 DUF3617 domain-containing protein [Pelomonas sp. PFR6]